MNVGTMKDSGQLRILLLSLFTYYKQKKYKMALFYSTGIPIEIPYKIVEHRKCGIINTNNSTWMYYFMYTIYNNYIY